MTHIIVLVAEAHRTQEGDLGRKMRDALPNAFLFGLTGTPINRADRNTFYAFGADADDGGYMSRYGLNEAQRQAIRNRNVLELIAAGGHPYYLAKFAGIFKLDMQDLGAQQTGMSKEAFRAKLIEAGK